MRSFTIFGILGVLAAVFVSAAFYAPRMVSQDSTASQFASLSPAAGGDAAIGGPFSLTDHNGKPVNEMSFHGRYMLVDFGYTFCPDICPATLGAMTEALKQLGPDAQNITPIFITVDPERDSPSVLKDYLSHFDPRFVGLTGTLNQVHAAEAVYKAYAEISKKSPDDKNYAVSHSSYIYLMGPDGKYLTHFPYTTDPKDIATEIRAAESKAGTP